MFQRTPGKKTDGPSHGTEAVDSASRSGDASAFRRVIQLCDSDVDRLEAAGSFLAAAFAAGEGMLVVATPEHRDAVEGDLATRGVHVAEVAGLGRHAALDAADTLAGIMAAGRPNPERFSEVIGGAMGRLASASARVRVYSEMGSLLYDAGNGAGARELEDLWASVSESRPLTLLSVYPIARLEGKDAAASFERVSTPPAVSAAIVDSSSDAIISKDLSGAILTWNRGAEQLFGYSADEVLGRPVTLLVPDERLQEEPQILARIRRGERIETYETVRRRKDGSLVDVSLTISPIRDPTGRIVGVSKIARDVTERRRTEAKLRESEERHERLVRLLPVGVYACENLSGTITYYNERAARIWGRRPAVGDPSEKFSGALRLFAPGSEVPLPHDRSPMARALREGREYRNEEILIERPDGALASVLVNIDPIVDADGRVTGAISVFDDVSALKEAQKALVEETNKLQTLLDVAPVAVLLAHDRECLRITGNREAARHLRMGSQENVSLTAPSGEAPTHFVVKRGGKLVEPELLPVQRAARGEPVSAEHSELVFDDGSVVHQIISAQPLYDESGEPNGAVACLQDVTELKVTERRLREADRRKDEFLAVLAHELRNPLAPIVSGLEIMELADDVDPETIARARSVIGAQARLLVTLVDDLLDISRLTSGRLELRTREVEITEVVEVAVAGSGAAIEQAGLRFVVDLPEAPIRLDADPDRLAQVLSNLLDNAMKFTPRGGEVSLTASARERSVTISVRDSGIGIPAEQLEHVFEMFSQLDRPQERGHSGLGMGLALVKQLVELHGGSVVARSAGVGQGTTVVVTLPALSKPPDVSTAPAEVAPSESLTRVLRVMVVDDNDAMLESLQMIIELLGHEVRTASDGQQAIDVGEEFRPDIVFMDLGMPRMGGYEAARRIRALPWGAGARLIALTGWGQAHHRTRSQEVGFDRHVVKPVRRAELERLFAES